MGRYLDALNAQFDEITSGIDEILDRAADEGRDPNKDELEIVNRDRAKVDELKKAIDHYSDLEVTRSKVAEARGKVPAAPQRTSTTVVVEREKDPTKQLQELFPTAGDYVTIVARSMRGDADAAKVIAQAIEISRDTAHQKLADNPGLLPRPILGPVIDLITGNRRFINSITARPLPTEKFDRPKVSQHVAVGIQEAEKTLTASRQLKVDNLPVAAKTFAGHLNLSRQNIKWSTPSLMQLVVESFGVQYAIETEADASAEFYASLDVDNAFEVDAWDARAIRRLLFAAAAKPLANNEELGFPDTFWMSTDVWGELGSMVSPLGLPEFPTLVPAAPSSGSIGGFNGVVVPTLPAGTAVIGRGALLEWYEDLDGLIQVAEPDVLGQLVGYAGFGAFLNTAPEVFQVLEFPPVPESEPEAIGAAATPTDSWTVAQIDAYAAEHGITVPDGTKADKLAAIAAATA